MGRKLPSDLSAAFEQLEEFCVQRKRTELRQGIRELLRRHPSNARALNRSLDWLWRSGQLKEGLHLALPRGNESRITSPDQLGLERALYWMMFLNSLSGWPWVVRWLPRIQARAGASQRNQTMIAYLLLAIGNASEALKIVEAQEEIPPRGGSAVERRTSLLHLRHAAALRLSEAEVGLKVNDEIQRLTPAADRIQRWAMELYRATFIAIRGNPAEALESFQRSDQGLPEAREIAPRLFAETRRHLAHIHFLLGDRARTLEVLGWVDHYYKDSLPDYSPMRRLEVLSLKSRWGLASDDENDFLAHYPGLRPDLITEASTPFLRDEALHRRVNPGPSRPRFTILPATDEYRVNETVHAGIPLELQLLALLARAKLWGIHRNLLIALLWPEQWMMQEALDARLSKLIQRLREEHRLEVLVDRECVFLDPRHFDEVGVDPFQKRPRILQTLAESQAQGTLHHKDALLADYGLGPTQGLALLQTWMDRGWIERQGRARNVRYRILPV